MMVSATYLYDKTHKCPQDECYPKTSLFLSGYPSQPPYQLFAKMRTIFCKCIWNKRRLSLLYLPYDRGGLSLFSGTTGLPDSLQRPAGS